MTDNRNPSPSDELLGKARGDVVGDGSDPGTFVPTSPADVYSPGGFADASDLHDDAETADASTELTAEDIAAELMEAQQRRAPEPQPEAPTYEVQEDAPATLPDWAVGPSAPAPAPPPASDHPVPATSDVAVGSPDFGTEVGQSLDDESVEDRWTTPTAEWEAYQAERAAKQKPPSRVQVPRFSFPRGRALAAVIGLAIFGISFLINQFDGKEAIADAAVGDCFIAGAELEINQVPVVDCSRKHDSELFAKVSMAGFGSTYPDEDMMFDWLFVECIDRFPAYVGEPYESSSYWVDMFIPTADGWDDGDYTGLCTIVVVDDDLNLMTTTGSARSSANNA
ncbi:MAG: septum formation family protein [Acidimicrobiia bacterium]